MQKITTFLWFDHQAEEAARFYVSIFKNARIDKIVPYPEGSPGTPGTVMTVRFLLEGQEFVAVNGGPVFTFSPAISLVVNCETQDEVNEMWEKLGAGGQPSQCAWLTDKFGVSWQIVPRILVDLLSDPDPAKASRVMAAMMKMGKIEIETLQRASAG